MSKLKIRTLISTNCTKEAIEQIQNILFDEGSLRNHVIVLSAQYHNLKERERLGITGMPEAVSELARINNSLLSVIDELPNESYHQTAVENAKQEYLAIKDLERESRLDMYEKIFKVLDKYKDTQYFTPHTYEILGFLYQEGLGTIRNEDIAYNLYKKSSEGNFEWGHYKLGVIYCQRKEYQKAMDYFRKAAPMGVGWAYIKIGDLYRDGLGIKKNYTKALEFYTKATRFELHWAYYCIGDLFTRDDSTEIEKDNSIAEKFFEKSLKLGNTHAEKRITKLNEK